ncbi:lycopene cyclase domain-containing protein [Saccharothrix australiensis]|uniref:Lycopene cyclase domain-containing protein n=1 Tax=Saccharothrix australiensis TaxID=2072 RepID=A0A495W2M7_9PSEU|nr:lycopene cyclase domain-containing protein [Saccharothrix australiensis]RKT55287.1 lycopene cyclase domain-containing protein [Saccharothrix australiensis]
MDRWQYLAVLVACLLVTAPLEPVGVGVYRRLPALARAIAPVLVLFGLWDLLAFLRGHWSFSEAFTTGVVVLGALPLEEVLFFVVVPLCAVLTYEAVIGLAARAGRARDRVGRLSGE